MHDEDRGASASLREIREARELTQAEVAAALATYQAEVSRIERCGDVRLSTLRRYARALGARCEVSFVLPSGETVRLRL
jgi:transcriptional regulator with XRE-family HTH domain